MDQTVTRTQYDPGTIRKFKRMCGVAALLMVLLLLRGDRGGGVEPSPASPVAKSIDFDAASRDATVSMVIAALETYGADPVFSVPISLHAGWVCAALLLNVNLANVQLKLGGDATTRQAIDLTLVFGSLYGATTIGAGVIALSGNVVLPLSIIWALVAIGVEAPNSAAGAKYTRAAVKYTALILAAKLAALAAFALKVGPEL